MVAVTPSSKITPWGDIAGGSAIAITVIITGHSVVRANAT
jgi:hypothetical protein